MEAVAVVRDAGAVPVIVVPLVDRGGTCEALARAEGLDYCALVTAPDLGFSFEGA
jgi:orotate phosphoribosyltransferase